MYVQEEASGCAPRLWSPHGKFPGAAFSRSIGDAVAEEIGVTAQPELHTQRLTGLHPFLILASDGLWEFVPSQTAVDMAMQYDDPQDAAAALVAEAQRRWLRADTRMDDITVIVVQLMVCLPLTLSHAAIFVAAELLRAGIMSCATVQSMSIPGPACFQSSV